MAVAVKNEPEVRAASPMSVQAVSLVGVVYLIASLAIVFRLIPSLWWGSGGLRPLFHGRG